ncbi:sulfite exporter TauE/SafE family protein [Desertibaculum subflavum]|uniref:sulfite exporter TauE/SafE family protein n=1 Tax=Desertibaculum subflavum TaxID=2268458 RepID=UPI000E666F10
MSDLLLAILPVFLLAGLVKGVIGLGLPTVAMGLLGALMPPAEAAALLIVPSAVTNIWQMLAGGRLIALGRRLWPMLAGICLGTWAGSGLLARDPTGHAATALGAALIVYALAGLAAPRLHLGPRTEAWAGLPIGALTGLITAATGVFVIPAVPFLQAIGLEKEELVQALGLSFTISTAALALGLARDGVFGFDIAGASLIALAPALAGMWLGQWIRLRVSAQTFRRCFFLGLTALGGYLVLRGVL